MPALPRFLQRKRFLCVRKEKVQISRESKRIPDPCNLGLNEPPEIEARFKDYKVTVISDEIKKPTVSFRSDRRQEKCQVT
ncbi:hypothetical protein Q1695_014691 [Nippostrongylus brasiliensis]|nr:hypothetical protein Q1695_014691 [Nippostrongylus brasiliensis]